MKNQTAATKLDALLQSWHDPSLGKTDAEWDDSADSIAQTAMAQGPSGLPGQTSAAMASNEKLIDSVLAPPNLAPEAGEPSSVVVGDFKMSTDRDPPSKSGTSAPPGSMRPRGSLKELAQRVSKTPPPSSVAPRASAPDLPAATLKAASSGSFPATATPLPVSAPPPSLRISEATAASEVAPVSSAGPASGAPASSISSSSLPAVSASAALAGANESTPATLPTGVTPIGVKAQKGNGMVVGIGVVLVGLAAAAGAFFYMKSQKPTDVVTAPAPQAQTTATAKAADDKAVEPKPEQAKAAPQDDGALDINKLGDATASATAVAVGGPLPTAPSAAPVAAVDEKKGPVKVNPDGTLDEAMQKAAGPGDGKQEVQPESAANTPKNLPDNPPQGSVTAAIGSVKGAARACVSGADDVSSATVVFGSSGAVQSVSVGGWAAGKPAAACIQSAMKGANVGAFSKPTFSIGVPIRP